eukprot:TRINITY_DN1097_c0_g1_i13.p1 TRINITY_DN1097_c0_g1~~TRINITY_DN1097_c0_g1_i13.p1  ORF type:complete len:643 (-),score=86.15 TRINITY_DN1097_c0_g1_i13:79-2007(-)
MASNGEPAAKRRKLNDDKSSPYDSINKSDLEIIPYIAGSKETTIKTPAVVQECDCPMTIAAGPDGTLYILHSEESSQYITCVSPGGLVSTIGFPQETHDEGTKTLVFAGGALHIRCQKAIFKLVDGKFQKAVEVLDRLPLDAPFTASSNGTYYFADADLSQRIVVLSPDGKSSNIDCAAPHYSYFLVLDEDRQLLYSLCDVIDVFHLSKDPVTRESLQGFGRWTRIALDPNGHLLYRGKTRTSVLVRLPGGQSKILFDLKPHFSGKFGWLIDSIEFAADGTLFVFAVDTAENKQWCMFTVRGLPCWKGRPVSLSSIMDWEPDFTLPINGYGLKLHKSFVERRCPALLSNTAAHSQPVEQSSVEIFRRYLYSESLPKDLTPRQLMSLAFLFQAAGLRSAFADCMKLLQDVPLNADSADATSQLIGLYCHSLDLGPFVEGEQVALYLLRKYRLVIAPSTRLIPSLLGQHQSKLIELMAMFVGSIEATEPDSAPHQSVGCASTSRPVMEALALMFGDRQKNGDFEIVIKGRAARKVHGFVMYAAWPYFRHMCDAGMKEKEARRLELPGATDDDDAAAIRMDGGPVMDEAVLDLIIEVAYTQSLVMTPRKLRGRLSVELALSVLSVSELYLRSDEKEQLYNVLVDE